MTQFDYPSQDPEVTPRLRYVADSRAEVYFEGQTPWYCTACQQLLPGALPGGVGNCSANAGNGHLLTKHLDLQEFPILTGNRKESDYGGN